MIFRIDEPDLFRRCRKEVIGRIALGDAADNHVAANHRIREIPIERCPAGAGPGAGNPVFVVKSDVVLECKANVGRAITTGDDGAAEPNAPFGPRGAAPAAAGSGLR